MPFRYRDAPLVEAVFEFAPHGAELPSEGSDRILATFADYTGKKDRYQGVGAQFDLATQQLTAVPATSRVRKWNEKRTRMVQFGADLCAFNALSPYTTFDDYVADMERLVTAYEREITTGGIAFLGQRYINRIAIPDGDPADYFTLFPGGEKASRRPGPFSIQFEFTTLPLGGNVMTTLVYQGARGGRHQYLLDLYAQMGEDPSGSFRWTDMSAWHHAAHDVIERAFEEPLTEKCRQLLGREEP